MSLTALLARFIRHGDTWYARRSSRLVPRMKPLPQEFLEHGSLGCRQEGQSLHESRKLASRRGGGLFGVRLVFRATFRATG